jgi:hypothetical protein
MRSFIIRWAGELAHEMLHKAERRTATTKTVREREAEAIAFVIGKAVGPEDTRHFPIREWGRFPPESCQGRDSLLCPSRAKACYLAGELDQCAMKSAKSHGP